MTDETLRQELQRWKVEPEIPARFQADVWARIASRQAAREDFVWSRIAGQLLGALARPAYATALIVAVMGFSLGAARIHADNVNARAWTALEARYAFSIDPYAQALERTSR